MWLLIQKILSLKQQDLVELEVISLVETRIFVLCP